MMLVEKEHRGTVGEVAKESLLHKDDKGKLGNNRDKHLEHEEDDRYRYSFIICIFLIFLFPEKVSWT